LLVTSTYLVETSDSRYRSNLTIHDIAHLVSLAVLSINSTVNITHVQNKLTGKSSDYKQNKFSSNTLPDYSAHTDAVISPVDG